MSDFALWDGTYEKEPYIALIEGKEVPCWANAGEMVACDGTDRYWVPGDNIQVRLCTHDEHMAATRIGRSRLPKTVFQLHAFASVLSSGRSFPESRHSEGGIMAKAKWAKRSNKRKHL